MHRVFKKEKFKCYKFHVAQKLFPGDNLRRIEWCNWLFNKIQENPDFLGNIIWTDECTFTSCGLFNRNNEHIWSRENPREFREIRRQGRFSVNVWAGIKGDTIIGPHFFENTLNAERYLNFLQTNFQNFVDEKIPLAELETLWFQHDGAPPHNGINVCEFLNHEFPDRWIGNRGVVRWPARSPDLTPPDYFLWGTLKNRVYKTEIQDIEQLKDRIHAAFRSIRRRDLRRTIENMKKRIGNCIAQNGGLFEHLM